MFSHLTFLPVAPGRLEFAAEVRQRLLELRPRVVAVELPWMLESAIRKAIRRLPEITVLLYGDPEEDQERAIILPVEPADPFIEAVRTAEEMGAEVLFIDPHLAHRESALVSLPDSYALRSCSYERYCELALRRYQNWAPAHALGMAWRLQGTDPTARTAVVLSYASLAGVQAALCVPQEEPPAPKFRELTLLNPHPECLAEILLEYPALQHRWELWRTQLEDDWRKLEELDRVRVQIALLRQAERAYEKHTGDTVAAWQRLLLARYARNLAITAGELVCGLFDLTLAARSIVDDNYAWEVWEAANAYEPQSPDSNLETVRLSAEEVWLHNRRLRLRRRLPSFKKRPRPSALKRRKKETRPGEWAEQLGGTSICSYPPEDIVIENYGRFLKRKAKTVLSEERERVYPFTVSLADGVDIRETIRNWHEGRIYVRHQERISGEVGAVIVIFDEDRDNRYPYLTTWLGEHQNESDMAFYSTPPFENLVGPGIGRAEYGGFLMTLPPRRMFDVWSDPDYDFAETKAERLLLAGLDYSLEKIVVYVAKKPPRSIFRSLAARLGQRILFIPIGQLSPDKLKKIRVVHVLDSHARRQQAQEYIW
jgi:hypothetical protein